MQPDFSLKITPIEKWRRVRRNMDSLGRQVPRETVTEPFGKQDTVDDGAATTEATPRTPGKDG